MSFQRDLILVALAEMPEGGNLCEIAEKCGLHYVEVGRLMKMLEDADEAHWNGRRAMESGRDGRVWFLGAHPVPEKRAVNVAQVRACERAKRMIDKLDRARFDELLEYMAEHEPPVPA